jgi:hypothetical protein
VARKTLQALTSAATAAPDYKLNTSNSWMQELPLFFKKSNKLFRKELSSCPFLT